MQKSRSNAIQFRSHNLYRLNKQEVKLVRRLGIEKNAQVYKFGNYANPHWSLSNSFENPSCFILI